jgi:hypothetical protein
MRRYAIQRGLGGHTSKQRLFYERVDGSKVYLQSSYEIDFASLLDEMGVYWERPPPLIWIDTDGVSHRYYPDFKIGQVYIDTKNDYLAIKDQPKIAAVREQNGIDVRIVTKDLITKEFIAAFV